MTPQLRFPEFTDEWLVKKLGDIFDYEQPTKYLVGSTEYDDSYATPVLTAGKTFILGYTDEKLGVYEKKLPITLFDDFTTASQWVDFPFKVKSSAAKILKAKKEFNPKIAHELLKRIRFKADDHQRYWISTYQGFEVKIPSKPEQEKIADFLTAVDERIRLGEQKLVSLEQYKRGVMQKIFSQQIRFKDKNGNEYPEWEEKKLGEVFIERTGKGGKLENMLSVTIKNGVVPFSTIDRKDNSNANKDNYKKVESGDIAYNSMRMWQGASGVSAYSGIVSPAYTVIKPKSGNVSEFWGYYFKLPSVIFTFQRYSQGLTSDTWNLKFRQLSEIALSTPIEEEQQKIANLLSALDQKIEFTVRKLHETKELKKGLLQRMLV